MSFSLPEGWKEVSLENVVDILDSQRKPINNKERANRIAGKDDSELYPYYGATGNTGFIDDFIFDEELVLLGEDGVPFFDPFKHKAYIINGKTWVNNHAHVLRAKDEITINSYLTYFLNYFDYHGYVNGATRLKLNQSNMKKIPFLLPPLTEQKQIAKKLDKLLARVERIKTVLDNAPAKIKRFRQSVLADAVGGEWKEVTIDDILENIRYGTSKKCSYDDTLTPVLRIPNIKDAEINTEDIKSASFNEKEFETLALKVGDILVIRSNGSIDLVGKNVVVTEEHENYIFAGYLIRVRLNLTLANPKYIHYVLSSPQIREVINITAKSTSGVNNLNSKEIGSFKVSLAPLKEQKAIVKKVETLFAIADKMEANLAEAQKRVDKLTQSILAKAFRGEII